MISQYFTRRILALLLKYSNEKQWMGHNDPIGNNRAPIAIHWDDYLLEKVVLPDLGCAGLFWDVAAIASDLAQTDAGCKSCFKYTALLCVQIKSRPTARD